ncbi:MAG: arginine--tRNA ligase [Candidatus Moranbacteria bacterium]|nr:arginine--tRNA ligase [Candidatus Moranbacteria bacterium]
MNLKQEIKIIIKDACQAVWPEREIGLKDIEASRPPAGFGDYSTNVALSLAKTAKKSPLETAEDLAEQIRKSEKSGYFEKIEAASPGFINFHLSEQALEEVAKDILGKKEFFGMSNLGGGSQAMVEFGQPNTHKAITVGHLKSAISGFSVVKLLEALGYKVIKANYFGDIGMHVAKTTWAMMKKELPKEFEDRESGEKMKLIDEAYVEGANAFKENPAAQEEIRKINKDIYDQKDNENYRWYKKIREWSLEHQAEVFKELGVEYDRQYPESEVFEEAIDIVKKYQGEIFEESEGAVIFNGKKEGLNNWVFLTGEGNPTYSAKDLALALKKFSEYELEFSIVTTSVEQTDYFKAIIRVLEKIDKKFQGRYRHIPFGWLLKGNKKTSSRMGETAKCIDVIKEAKELAREKISVEKDYSLEEKEEIIEKVALAGLKFLILSREFHKDINYDPNDFIKLSGFSGPFILYSYVRTKSVLGKVGSGDSGGEVHLNLVKNEERELAGALAAYPDIAEKAGTEIAPHLVCNYLYDLGQKFNAFYEVCPIQKADTEALKNSRLALVKSSGQIFKNGLGLLGIETLEKM